MRFDVNSSELYGGLVREARRPEGWEPPGPVPPEPPPPGEAPDLWPQEGEDLCYLTGHWRIFQRLKGHRYSIDDLMTAWTAAQVAQGRAVRRYADIGCGIGSVLMMVSWSLPEVQAVGVEAQALSFGLARRSVRYNAAEGRIEVRHGDLRDPENTPEGAAFDLVTGTPPYIPLGDGVVSEREQCGPCRFEMRGGVEDYCLAAARLLAPQGRFVVCHAAPQAARVEAAALAAGLTTLRRCDVVPRDGRGALFSVFVMARQDEIAPSPDGAPLEIDPPFVVRDAEGRWTEAYRAVRRGMGMPCGPA